MRLSLLLPAILLSLSVSAQSRAGRDSLPVYDPLAEATLAVDWPEEEEYAGYFRPAVSGNGQYVPMGQLSRNLISMRFRARGYDNRYVRYEVNGAEIDNLSEGFPAWQLLTAVQLLPRSYSDVSGLGIPINSLGGLGGVTSISTTDRYLPATTRLTYGLTNRSYTHRATASTRLLLANDWTLSVAGSYRGGKDGFVSGVSTDLAHGAFSLVKRWENQILSLTGAGVYGEQGVRSAATQEAYGLAGTNYYNPNWGYQSGEKRNGKARGYRQGFGVLAYEGRPQEMWTLRASLSVTGGENSFSQPAWYNAANPYPDYYRYMPSFFDDSSISNAVTQEWMNGNTGASQLDWSKLYEANRFDLDENGVRRSAYILRDRMTRRFDPALSASFEYRPAAALTVRGGVRAKWEQAQQFARLKDLLGGSYWLDVDPFLLDDDHAGGYQSDVRNPDRAIFEGDRFGYDYRMTTRAIRAWGSLEYQSMQWQALFGVEAGTLGYQRTGRYEKENFPGGQSYGPSGRVDFPEYQVKGELFWTPRLQQRWGIRVMHSARAPLVKNVFISPDFRNTTVDNIQSVRISGGEVVYQYVTPELRFDAAVYYTAQRGDSEIRSFYDDIFSEYVNGVLTGVDRTHWGVEAGLEWAATPRLSMLAAVSWNRYTYSSNPPMTLLRDSDGQELLAGESARIRGLYLSGTPQTAALLQLNYRTRNYWRFEGSVKYTGNNYVSINPFRRMDRAVDLGRQPFAEQERLENAVLVGLSVSRNFRLPNGHTLGLWANADNLLDNRSIRYSGYEQMRFYRSGSGENMTLSPFPSKYYYAYGANVYLLISYTF